MFIPEEFDETKEINIKVIGIGGMGCNAVDHLIESCGDSLFSKYENMDMETWAVNTDIQSLRKSKSFRRLQIGSNMTRGLG
ncbi:hypothetical protein GVX81_10075 [[Haemophilus] felis]|uniref:Tubulin/FtsZ GTPase domain-containing protein n=1 Tax=[Haemophilus] felis TaxID=123822 RepID=A0A1T0AXZ0_9PAST|nr:hypothetical protein [[Haemophilus] felis]NBI41629.1 hypothetical protein [[Haemophilus] felis]OOS02810.1 hypothetical protein B0188_07290 [[Haemophilus] felis]